MSSGDLFGGVRGTAPARTVAATEAVFAHCDGGARGNPGPSGYGAVVATADGTKLAELSEFLGNRTNNYAEYSGLLGVLAWALENGRLNVRVVSDSELMVKQIQGKYKVNSPDLRPLFDEAKRRIAKLESFGISHALRHKNKDADRLANEAMDRGTGRAVPPEKRAFDERATAPLLAPHERKAAVVPRVAAAAEARPVAAAPVAGEMLRGFVRGGAIHLLGGKTLPDGVFVKVVQE